jgi:hypothetical protein
VTPPLTGTGDSGYSAAQDVLQRIERMAVPYGREQSFKLVPGRLLSDRLLVGVHRRGLPAIELQALAGELGMPGSAWEALAARLPQANAVFVGTEEAPGACMLKMYLEFWDEVRQAVRDGARDAQLLHFGVKWSTARLGQFEEARYMCHPLLSVRDILRRMPGCYPADRPSALAPARTIVRRAAHRAPGAAFLYLEVQEAGNPRRSFDINLYKSGLLVRDAADEFRAAASHLGVPLAGIEGQLEQLGHLPLGHISGGSDRRGAEFLSVYAEIAPLPEG